MSQKTPMDVKDMTISILGLGRAGRSLALTLNQEGRQILPWKNRDRTPTLLFIATPDRTLQKIALELSQLEQLPKIVVYLAGCKTLETLAPIAHRTHIAQFHPLTSLDGQSPIPEQTLIGICSNHEPTKELLFTLAKQLRLDPVNLQNGTQPLYHAAASLTGNLSLALVAQSIDLMHSIGIPEQTARPALAKLLRSAANAVEKRPVKEALTGPIARKDLGTIKAHLRALKKKPPLASYRTLSKALFALLSASNSA